VLGQWLHTQSLSEASVYLVTRPLQHPLPGGSVADCARIRPGVIRKDKQPSGLWSRRSSLGVFFVLDDDNCLGGIASGGSTVVFTPPEKPRADAAHSSSLAWPPSGRLQIRSPSRLFLLSSCAEAPLIPDSSETDPSASGFFFISN